MLTAGDRTHNLPIAKQPHFLQNACPQQTSDPTEQLPNLQINKGGAEAQTLPVLIGTSGNRAHH